MFRSLRHRSSVLVLAALLSSSLFAQQSATAADYYDGAYRLSGPALRTALHNIIKGHTSISYDALYTAFPSTDSKPNGKVWDIYSDIPGGTPPYEFDHGQRKCGTYNSENDCYNREHSWPDSWLGASNPARTDLFHLYPTDGYVNNRRSNYPYGVVTSPTWTSLNGSKVGPNTFPGYSNTVFEPINEYKGDLARSMMYMSVRYYLEDSPFIATDATNKSDLLPWYANLVITWSTADTVSKKEVDRNNAIFAIQKNRNPFIDHPEFAPEIWNTTAAPKVVSVTAPSLTTIIIDYSRYLDSIPAKTTTNYVLDHGIGNAQSVKFGVVNDISKLVLTVPALQPGTQYTLQLKNVRSINTVAMNDTVVTFKTSGIAAVTENGAVPEGFRLDQNHPNPFNPTTTIGYQLPASGEVTLSIEDALGREVSVLVTGMQHAGPHTAVWDATRFASGMYVARLQSGGHTLTRKIVLTK